MVMAAIFQKHHEIWVHGSAAKWQEPYTEPEWTTSLLNYEREPFNGANDSERIVFGDSDLTYLARLVATAALALTVSPAVPPRRSGWRWAG